MERLNPRARRDAYGSKINRDHSPVLAVGVVWLSIMLASLTPILPIISSAPVVPPLALMLLIAWRLSRPALLPLWAGFFFGLFDDLFSGQPLGSGIMLFSLALIALDLIEARFPWSGFWQDWAVASLIIAVYIAVAALVSGAEISYIQLGVTIPQILIALALFPLVARIVTLLDRLRLSRVRRLS